jgi:ADP-ribose pyrophosphatase YjhB (NUDIX family)
MGTGRSEFLAGLPRKVAAAGALVTDPEGRVLIVKPTYKPRWEVPGGCIETGETARQACRRELAEELGLTFQVGRLLVVEHQTAPEEKGDSIMFIYDGGVLAGVEGLALGHSEIEEARFVDETRFGEFLPPRQARRMAQALRARQQGELVEMVNGEVVPSGSAGGADAFEVGGGRAPLDVAGDRGAEAGQQGRRAAEGGDREVDGSVGAEFDEEGLLA